MARSRLFVDLSMVSTPEGFEQCCEEEGNATDDPHHLLCQPEAMGSDSLFVVAEPIMTDLFQLQVQRASGSGHRMTGIRTGSLPGVTPPDLPGFGPIAAEERGECNNKQGCEPGREHVQYLVCRLLLEKKNSNEKG